VSGSAKTVDATSISVRVANRVFIDELLAPVKKHMNISVRPS